MDVIDSPFSVSCNQTPEPASACPGHWGIEGPYLCWGRGLANPMRLDWLLPEPWLWGPTVFWKQNKQKKKVWKMKRLCLAIYKNRSVNAARVEGMLYAIWCIWNNPTSWKFFCCERNACSVGLSFGYSRKGSSKCSYIPCQGNDAFFFTLQPIAVKKLVTKLVSSRLLSGPE